jgi:protein MpaA
MVLNSPFGCALAGNYRLVLAAVTVVALTLLHAGVASAGSAPRAASKAASAGPQKISSQQLCERLSERLPGVTTANCRAGALVPTGAHSRNGLPIMIRRYAAPRGRDASRSSAPIRILLLGGIHGDELTSSAIVFQWMRALQAGSAQNFHWEVVPVLNPDGLMAPRPSRVNAGGVDLNRNFPTPNWANEAPRYWARETGSDPRRYPGKAALSEPETRWVNDELQRFRPNLIISVHAPFGVLDFDGPAPAPQRFGRLALNPVGVYPGSLGNYSGKFRNVPVITIELPNALTMPNDGEVQRIWTDMLAWINRNVARQDTVLQRQVGPPGSAPAGS